MSFLLDTVLSKLAIKHKGYFALAAKHATHILTPCNTEYFVCFSVYRPVTPQAFLFITLTTEFRFLNRAVNTSRRLDAICRNWRML